MSRSTLSPPPWAGNFFTGVPAPAGAIVVLLPIYLSFLRVPVPVVLTFVYTLAIAGLMVSLLPVLSGKKMGTRVRPTWWRRSSSWRCC